MLSAADASCAVVRSVIPNPPAINAPIMANTLRIFKQKNKLNYICIMAYSTNEHNRAQCTTL